MGLDPYPIVKPTGQNDLAMVGEWTRLGQDAVKGSRPLWMVLQYFPLTAAGGWPTEAELRAMSWMAIIEGARGLLYWSFGEKGLAWIKDPREREQKWAELVRVTKEIKALEPVLLAPDAAVVSRESSGGAVRALGKAMPDGARYLFAYNTRNDARPRHVDAGRARHRDVRSRQRQAGPDGRGRGDHDGARALRGAPPAPALTGWLAAGRNR